MPRTLLVIYNRRNRVPVIYNLNDFSPTMSRTKTEKASARPTMVDIAKLAGVSQATVSMVLNDTGGTRVQEKTRKLVRDAAEQLGYRVWLRAPVGGGGLQAIGFVIDDSTSNPIVNKAIDAARQLAWENGAVLVVLPTQGDERLRASALELLFAHRVVGVIFAAFFTRRVHAAAEDAVGADRADQLLHEERRRPGHPAGARAGAEAAVAHPDGGRTAASASSTARMMLGEPRPPARLPARAEAGRHRLRPRPRPLGQLAASGGHDCTRELLALEDRPTAIFCASDKMAIGCYEAIKEAGLRLPDDISIVGFDDDPTARYLDPPLTTILVPHEDMGRRAVTHLYAKRSRTDRSAAITGRLQIECPLVERNSVAPPRAAAAQRLRAVKG